jgi:hypothetical protein
MGNIDWNPIADIPDALKDGREVLLWETNVEGQAEIATWDPAGPAHMPIERLLTEGVWCDRDGATIHGITHFAEINAPA